MPIIQIGKTFTFEAAHKLPQHKGKCKELHGHTYTLIVTIQGELRQDGMVLDFSEIKEVINIKIIDRLDHTYLNNTIPNPTAENILLWIYSQVNKEIQIYELELWETKTSFAKLRINK